VDGLSAPPSVGFDEAADTGQASKKIHDSERAAVARVFDTQ